jgi:hypothetical protein
MDSIVEPDKHFNFSKLVLTHPVSTQGGSYFTKIEYNNKPLYIQTPKSLTKQGFVKVGKKYYCDLMFDRNSEELIHWFENLEERCQKLIYEKCDSWFQNTLEEPDIESAFNSLIKVYKFGKFYLLRCSVKNTDAGTPMIKIYDEQQNPVPIENVNGETNVISILEIRGIKFTTRNFLIEVELKQMMVLDKEPTFDSCLIKKHSQNESAGTPVTNAPENEMAYLDDLNLSSELNGSMIELDKNISSNLETIGNSTNNDNINNANNTNDNINNTNINAINEVSSVLSNINLDAPSAHEETPSTSSITEEPTIELDFEELKDMEPLENTNDLKEMTDLSMENLETIQLKRPNEVYHELYKEARKKAKLAKKNAIIAFLEAKNIKKTYMIDNLNDSDSDIESDIDNVSESDLEQF